MDIAKEMVKAGIRLKSNHSIRIQLFIGGGVTLTVLITHAGLWTVAWCLVSWTILDVSGGHGSTLWTLENQESGSMGPAQPALPTPNPNARKGVPSSVLFLYFVLFCTLYRNRSAHFWGYFCDSSSFRPPSGARK